MQGDHAIGGGQAALQAMLRQQDRGIPLLVEAAQEPDQLIPGDGIQLGGGLVEQQHGGAPREGGAERDALLLAAGERVGGAVQQVVDAERERDLLDSAGDRAGPMPAALERQRELRAHRAHHELALGVLEERARERPQARGPVLAGVQAGELHAPREAPAVKVRHQATGGAQQRRLAMPGEAREHAELARAHLEAQVLERRALGAGVAVGDLVEGEDAHGLTALTTKKGARTTPIPS